MLYPRLPTIPALLCVMGACSASAAAQHIDQSSCGATPAAAHCATVLITARAPAAVQASSFVTGNDAAAMDVPFSVTRISGERLREQAVSNLHDALRNVPGAQADSGFNGAHTQFFTLRGAIADSGTGSNRILRDGVRLSNYPYVPAFIDSIDVLRGPGAAIGVRSEPGGTVNIGTRQPRMDNTGSALLSFGQHAARELTVDLNRVISAEDELAARVIATRSQASQWRHVPDRLDAVRLALAKADGARYRLRAGFEAINQDYRPDYGIPALDGRPAAIPSERQFSEPFADSTTDTRIVDLHADVALAATSRLALDLTHLEAQSTSVKNLLTGSPLAGQPAGTYARVSAWEPGSWRRIDSLATSLSSRQTTGALTHTLFFGLDWYREDLDQPTLSVPPSTSPSINLYAPVYGRVTAPPAGTVLARSLTVQHLTARCASAQDQIDLGAWSLVAGLRYTSQDFVYGAANVLPVSESDWSPKLGLLYRAAPHHTLYANLATGLAPNQVASSSNQSLPSRKATQAEAGWKSLWLDGALMGDVALYRLKQTNMISADQSTPLNNFDFTIGGSARSQGLEASLAGALGARIELSLAYAYTDAAYLRNAVYGGKRVPNVGRHAWTLWGQYRWGSAAKSGVSLVGQSARYADLANTTTLPGYARFDLTHTWRRQLRGERSLELQFALRNAFDRRYAVSSHLHVSRWIMPAEGRHASLSARVYF